MRKALLAVPLVGLLVGLYFVVPPYFSRPKTARPDVPLEGWYVEKDKSRDTDATIPRRRGKVAVFVHGVTGDGDGTWRPEPADGKSFPSWPELMRHDPEFGDHDVFVVSYDSPKIRKGPGIVELAAALNDTLTEYRILPKDDELGRDVPVKEIVFIGHSMGNLIVRTALMIDRAYETDAVRVPLILTVASPSAGSSIAQNATRFSSNAQFAAMKGIDRNPFLQLLNTFWNGNAPWETEIACAYEMKKLEVTVVVDQASATAVCSRRGPGPLATPAGLAPIPAIGGFDEDHSSIVKPKAKDGIYRWAAEHIKAARSPRYSGGDPPRWKENTIVFGGKDFLEANILVAMMALAVKPDLSTPCPPPGATPCVNVERKYHIGGRDRVFEELANGTIDLYPEYTGTLLTNLVDLPVVGLREDKYHSMEYLNKQFAAKRNLRRFEVITRLGFDNSYQLIVRRKTAERLGLSAAPTISELADKSKTTKPPLRLESTPDFFYRRDGVKGLKETYKLVIRTGYTLHAAKYQHLRDGDADIVDAYTTDPQLRDSTQTYFVPLRDDQYFFPRYYATGMTTSRFLNAFEAIHLRESLGRLENKVSETDITNLIAKVAKHGVRSEELPDVAAARDRMERVVKEFLIEKKVIPDTRVAGTQSRPVAQGAR